MKSIIFSLIILLLNCLTLHAEGLYMHIQLKNSATLVTDITEMPKISFENGIMSIGTERIHVENIVKYTINDSSEESIELQSADKMRVDLSNVAQGMVTVNNIGNQTISLYDVSGKSLPFKVSKVGQTTTIDFRALTSGIYVLTIGDQPIKCKKQ